MNTNNWTIESYDLKNVAFEQKTCGICREDYSEKELVVKLACQHIFHSECFTSAIVRCPFCQRTVTHLTSNAQNIRAANRQASLQLTRLLRNPEMIRNLPLPQFVYSFLIQISYSELGLFIF